MNLFSDSIDSFSIMISISQSNLCMIITESLFRAVAIVLRQMYACSHLTCFSYRHFFPLKLPELIKYYKINGFQYE